MRSRKVDSNQWEDEIPIDVSLWCCDVDMAISDLGGAQFLVLFDITCSIITLSIRRKAKLFRKESTIIKYWVKTIFIGIFPVISAIEITLYAGVSWGLHFFHSVLIRDIPRMLWCINFPDLLYEIVIIYLIWKEVKLNFLH